jgi:hypothetical protein
MQDIERRILIPIHRMNQLQCWPIFFPEWEQAFGFVPIRGALLFFVGAFAIGERLVIDPTAFLKLLLKDTPLAVREIDAVFEGFSHTFSITYSCAKPFARSKAAKANGKGLYPRAKAPGVYALDP